MFVSYVPNAKSKKNTLFFSDCQFAYLIKPAKSNFFFYSKTDIDKKQLFERALQTFAEFRVEEKELKASTYFLA